MGSTAPLPPDLQKILDDTDAAYRAGDAIVAGLTGEQLHWQPDGGKAWSIAQGWSRRAHDRRHLWQAEQVARRVLQRA